MDPVKKKEVAKAKYAAKTRTEERRKERNAKRRAGPVNTSEEAKAKKKVYQAAYYKRKKM